MFNGRSNLPSGVLQERFKRRLGARIATTKKKNADKTHRDESTLYQLEILIKFHHCLVITQLNGKYLFVRSGRVSRVTNLKCVRRDDYPLLSSCFCALCFDCFTADMFWQKESTTHR